MFFTFLIISTLFAQTPPPAEVATEPLVEQPDTTLNEVTAPEVAPVEAVFDDDFDFDAFEADLGLEQNNIQIDQQDAKIVYYIFTPVYWIAENLVEFLIGLVVLIFLTMALRDFTQRSNPLKRNFPLMAMGRYFLAAVGPPLRQYLFANDKEERPIPRHI